MSEVLELNKEEIFRLSNMDDSEGYAWALYLLLKKNIDIYTGIVQVDSQILAEVFAKKLNLDYQLNKRVVFDKLNNLMLLLLKAEIISGYCPSKDYISIRLPIAITETCLESSSQH